MYLTEVICLSLFQSPQRDSGQGGEMSVAPGNSTLAATRN